MKVRSKAPLRLGIAGGGTDVSPYSEEYGGCVLNVTISMYAYCFLSTDSVHNISFSAQDLDQSEVFTLGEKIDLNDGLILHRAVYLRIVHQFNGGIFFPVSVSTFCDAPFGSGLGSSSTLVVAMVEAYRQLLGLPLGEYDIAQLAYDIERSDCGLSGGKQDQYAATFGGFNFMEFESQKVIVNPLRIRNHIVNEFQASLVLYFTGVSRKSAEIIEDQQASLSESDGSSLLAMHKVKESSYRIKELMLKADMDGVIDEFRASWSAKKRTSRSISNSEIDLLESDLLENGARSVKLSGAGGGGFMMIFVEPEMRLKVVRTLEKYSGSVFPFEVTNEGAYSWII